MKHLVVGISGASGAVLGIEVLRILQNCDDVTTHLIVTHAGRSSISEETDLTVRDVLNMADHVYQDNDLGAALSSGSFKTDGMIVAPCSIKTLSGVANCYDDGLLVRAADVTLKERRPLLLMLRETPIHLGHMELMATAARSGAILMPPVPSFYLRPNSVSELVHNSASRALDVLGFEVPSMSRWHGRSRTTKSDAGTPEKKVSA